jgi:membrane-bound lytic murein transglycosylase D
VAAGDTLFALARRYETDEHALRQLNGLRSEHLQVGQRVRVPRRLPRGASTSRRHAIVRGGDRLVVVREGDTLWELSKLLHVPVDRLMAVNGGAPSLRPSSPPPRPVAPVRRVANAKPKESGGGVG